MTALIETSSDRWTRMIRSTGVVGLVTFVVLFAAIIAISPGEPPFLASPEEALAFYLNSTAGWVQAAMAVVGLAAIGWIWFVVGLCLLLARAEGSPPWRSAVALVSGVILASVLATQYQRERRLVRCRRPRSGSCQLRLRCQPVSGLPTSGSPWALLRHAPAGWCCRLASSVVGLAGGRSPAGWGSCSPDSSGHRMVLVFAVRRLLDLDDHHVHPACPQAARGAEGGRRASQPWR